MSQVVVVVVCFLFALKLAHPPLMNHHHCPSLLPYTENTTKQHQQSHFLVLFWFVCLFIHPEILLYRSIYIYDNEKRGKRQRERERFSLRQAVSITPLALCGCIRLYSTQQEEPQTNKNKKNVTQEGRGSSS